MTGVSTEDDTLVPADALEAAAARLRDAEATRVPCPPVRDLVSSPSVADAYAVQQLNRAIELGKGRRAVGWKIGLTSKVVQQQLGVDQPDFGLLFADTGAGDDEPIDVARLLQPRFSFDQSFGLFLGSA